MADVFDVARYILDQLGAKNKLPITTWKLQKLVYYSQAWHAVWADVPLFPDRIEAWANGPVSPKLYQIHKGQFQIKELPAGCGEPKRLSNDERESIDIVLEHYGSKTAQYLSELSHREHPWVDAREGVVPGDRGSKEISVESMVEYYGSI